MIVIVLVDGAGVVQSNGNHFQSFEVLSASINILKAFLYSLLKYHIFKLQF